MSEALSNYSVLRLGSFLDTITQKTQCTCPGLRKWRVITCKIGNNRQKEKDYTVVPDYTRFFFVFLCRITWCNPALFSIIRVLSVPSVISAAALGHSEQAKHLVINDRKPGYHAQKTRVWTDTRMSLQL